MSAKVRIRPALAPRKDQLQELYKWLDRTGPDGHVYLAWYGQLRAQEVPHREALEQTVEHFGLDRYEWWQLRGLR